MIKFSFSVIISLLLVEIIEGREQPGKKYEPKISEKCRREGKQVEFKIGITGRGKPRQSSQRIINGTRVDKASFPFLVSVQAHNVKHDMWTHGCGGSIITASTVLTACHCVGLIVGNRLIYGNPKKMRVVAGTSSLRQPSTTAQIRRVSRTRAHPKCSNFPTNDNRWFENDVSLMELEKPFELNAHVQPMKLFSTDENRALGKLRHMVYQGKTCVVPGWGSTVEFKTEPSKFLMASTVKLIPDESCRALYCTLTKRHCNSNFRLIGQVCALSKDSSDCQGDSGGPLVCDGQVFGTVSYGERCIPGWPSVFQGVRPILELIHIHKNTPFGGGAVANEVLNTIDHASRHSKGRSKNTHKKPSKARKVTRNLTRYG